MNRNQHTPSMPSEFLNINIIHQLPARVQSPCCRHVWSISPILPRFGHKCLPLTNRKPAFSLCIPLANLRLSQNTTPTTDVTEDASARRNLSIWTGRWSRARHSSLWKASDLVQGSFHYIRAEDPTPAAALTEMMCRLLSDISV